MVRQLLTVLVILTFFIPLSVEAKNSKVAPAKKGHAKKKKSFDRTWTVAVTRVENSEFVEPESEEVSNSITDEITRLAPCLNEGTCLSVKLLKRWIPKKKRIKNGKIKHFYFVKYHKYVEHAKNSRWDRIETGRHKLSPKVAKEVHSLFNEQKHTRYFDVDLEADGHLIRNVGNYLSKIKTLLDKYEEDD